MRPTAADPALAGWLAAADVIHFPGGDPDLIPTVMLGIGGLGRDHAAHAGGAVLAGASAGAMAFGSWTWTPGGGMAGLKVVRGLVVVPHARGHLGDDGRAVRRVGARRASARSGLAEMTGVIEEPLRPAARRSVARRRAGRGALAGRPRAAARRSWLARAR